MQIIDIKNKKWTVGLEWEILPGEASFKEEAKEIAEKNASNFGILVEYEGKFSIGLSKKTNPKNPSANLYLALANQESRNSGSSNYYPDWIVVEEVGDEKYWMAIIKDGIPTPQSDAILDITTVKDRIIDLIVNDTFTVYSHCIEIRALFEGQKEVIELGLNELTQDVDSKIKFLKLRGIPDELIKAGFVALILMGLAFAGYSFKESQSFKERQRVAQMEQEKEQQQKIEAYKSALGEWEKVKTKNENEAKNKIKLSMRTNPAGIVSAWYGLVGGIETGTHGWKLGKIECYVNNSTTAEDKPEAACDILFNRTGLSTTRMFLQDYPDATIKGDEALVKRKISVDNSFLNSADDNMLNNLPTAKHWGFDMISQLQLLKIVNIEHEIKPSASITYTIPAKPISPDEQARGIKAGSDEQKSLGFAAGQIIIKNDNFELVKEVVDNVDFKGVAVKKAIFEPRDLGVIAWEMQLDYYVKEDNTGGITGSNTSGLSNNSVTAVQNGQNAQSGQK